MTQQNAREKWKKSAHVAHAQWISPSPTSPRFSQKDAIFEKKIFSSFRWV